MQAVLRCEELKTCKFLLTFLSQADVKIFTKVQKDAEKIREQLKNRNFNDLVTINGVGKLFISRNCQTFCETNMDITDFYFKLYREIIDCSKELAEKAQDFAATFHQLQKMITQMGEHHKRVQSNA